MQQSASFWVAQAVTAVLVGVVGAAMIGFKDASDALAFYGVYHREPINQAIHFVGVPTILFTIMIFCAHLPVGNYSIQLPFTTRHTATWSTLIMIQYTLFYLYIDPIGGILYFPILYGMYVACVYLREQDQLAAQKKTDSTEKWMGTGKLLQYASFFHVVAWYIQIHPGHAIYEGAKPAIMDSLGGALTSAPLFAFYEGVWLLGINKGLQEHTNELVADYTARLCAEGAVMRVCESL